MLIIGSSTSKQINTPIAEIDPILANAKEADLILLGVKDLNKVADWGKARKRRLINRLTAFQAVGARPFPNALVGKKILFVNTVDSKLLKACHAEGLELFFAKSSEDGSLVGAEKQRHEIELHPWVPGGDYYVLGEASLSTLSIQQLIEVTSKLSTADLKRFLTLYLGSLEEEGNKISIVPIDGNEKLYSKILLDLETGVVTTNREFAPIRWQSFLFPVGRIVGHSNLAILAVYLAGNAGRSIKDINGILAFLTQCWEEEDTYGMVMSNRQRLRHVRHHSAAVMKIIPSTSFPFFYLENFNNLEGIHWAAQECEKIGMPYFLDKYGSKRIVVGPGVHGLYLGNVCDEAGKSIALRFITETAKEKKLPNRPWNSTAIVAEEGIPGTPGYRPYSISKMRVKSQGDDGEVLLLEELGDKRRTVFTNKTFAVNGSGVGDVGSELFAYSLSKSIRGTFNSINLKAGQTLEDAASEISADLEQMIKEGKVLSANDRSGFRQIYSYNGVPLLSFSGYNQDLILDQTCHFEVKHTPTSESLLISLAARLSGSFHEVKFRGLGIKAVLKQTEMELLKDGLPMDYEVHMGIECQKGFSWVLPMFCEAMCDQNNEEDFAVLDPDQGVIYFPLQGFEVDLSNDESRLVKWINSNKKEFITVDRICRDEFEYYTSLHDFSEVIEWEIDPDDEELVIVRESVVGIVGWFTGNVEVSTRPENTSVGSSYMTLEQLAGIAINAPALAAFLA